MSETPKHKTWQIASYSPNPKDTAHFCSVIGHALISWQTVESSIYALFHCLLSTDFPASSLTFFHIQSASSRVVLIDKLCRARLDKESYKDAWTPIKKNLVALIANRNQIAHYEMALMELEDLPEKNKSPIMLSASHADYEATIDGKRAGHSLEDIHGIAGDFIEMTEQVCGFIVRGAPEWQESLLSLPEGLQINVQAAAIEDNKRGDGQPPPENKA